MCPDRFSLTFQIIKSALPEAERASPGGGCELLTAFAAVGDVALIAGVVTGIALAYSAYELAGSILSSRRYRQWKASCNGD